MTDLFKSIRAQDARLRPTAPNHCWSLQFQSVKADGERRLVLVDDFSGQHLASIPESDVTGPGVVRMLDGAVAARAVGPSTMISDMSEALFSPEVLMWAISRRVEWCRVKVRL